MRPSSLPRRPGKPRLAYILACSHSGSTLLAMLLGAHPEAITVGELSGARTKQPERYRCSCGEVITECSFWSRVIAGMKARGIDYDPIRAGTDIRRATDPVIARLVRPLHRGPFLEMVRDCALGLYGPWHRHLEEVQKRSAGLLETLVELSGARVVVDSGKVGLRLKYLLRNKALDVRVIRLIRDGRGVSLTVTDEGQFADATDPGLRAGGFGNEEWCRTMPISFGANMWRRSNEEGDCLVAGLDKTRWTEVRYEDLCAKPAETLRSVCAFLDLDPERIVLDFRSVEQHVIGNGMRLNRTSEVRLDERWREHLTDSQRTVFEQIAGRLNRKYGYR
jgi:hypothetical protein